MAESPNDTAPPVRLTALDAFRGLTILLMLLVNNVSLGGATPKTLTHADWSGNVHLADVVFPWFLLAVGVAVPFAVASHRKRGDGWLGYYGKAIRRTAGLVLLGILVDSTVNGAWTPGLGVLQVIGLAYLVAAFLSPLPTIWRGVAAAFLLAAHSVLLLFWDVPGHGAGRIVDGANAVAYLNTTYLQPLGVKGLVSVIPTAGMVLFGTALGDLFRRKNLAIKRRAAYCAAVGILLTVAGYGAGFVLPMNKPLWTASYILFTAGLGAVVLAMLHLVVDGTKAGTKAAIILLVPGTNAITAYVLPILVKIVVLQGGTVTTDAGRVTLETALQTLCYETMGRVSGGWFYTAAYIGAWWLVLFFLYRRQWFLRV